jgi:transcriptional regulator with GAF, ATPase, and Fis domain
MTRPAGHTARVTSGEIPPAQGPRLIAIAGPLYGEVMRLNEPELTIGRDPSNAVCLADLLLSRRHCVISLTPVPRVSDVGSSNGTFVNGMQITDHVLADGDRLQVGESVFVFVSQPAAAGYPPVRVGSGESEPSTTKLRLEDARYLRREPADMPPAGGRAAQGLQTLLRISAALNGAGTEDEIHKLLVDLLAEAIPADQTAILGPGGAAPVVINARTSGDAPLIEVSSAVLRQALEGRVGVLTRGTRTTLCVPIARRNRVLGAIYLMSTQPDVYDDEHLELVAGVAGAAATAIENARRVAWLESETERLQSARVVEHALVGRSQKMVRIYERVGKVARTDATVLITGETGTGKELIARAIHVNSARAKRPFVAINCAALTEALLESELFGHERGAFTNAIALKKGKLEIADGGTVFLDEVGELAPALQSKLLRVLQEHELERVGGTRVIPIDVRIVSASNRVLQEEVAARRFREDLYHRLNVVAIHTPPLRERQEDIPLLAHHFLWRFAAKANRPLIGFSGAALQCLTDYAWPGNVRELQNAIERAVVLGSSEEVVLEDLPESLLETATAPAIGSTSHLHDVVRQAKVHAIQEAFRQAGHHYTDTARLLGIHPNYLHRLIRNLGLKALLEREP